ncbi:hypothetical protein EJB05_15435, partial [Eragrostis curvula]
MIHGSRIHVGLGRDPHRQDQLGRDPQPVLWLRMSRTAGSMAASNAMSCYTTESCTSTATTGTELAE